MGKGPSNRHRAKASATKAQKRKGATFTPREPGASRPLTDEEHASRDLVADGERRRAGLEDEYTGDAVDVWKATVDRLGAPEVVVIVDATDDWARATAEGVKLEPNPYGIAIVTMPPVSIATALRRQGSPSRVVEAAGAKLGADILRLVVLAGGAAGVWTHRHVG